MRRELKFCLMSGYSAVALSKNQCRNADFRLSWGLTFLK